MNEVTPDKLRRQGRPSPIEAEAIDRAIEEAVLAEAAEGCMSAISIERIAARAGVTRTAIYRRFAGRTELIRAAIAARVGHVKGTVAAALDGVDAPLERLHDMLHVLAREANSHAGLDFRRLLIATGPHEGEIRQDLLDAMDHFNCLCDEALGGLLGPDRRRCYSVPDMRELLLDTLSRGRITSTLAIRRDGEHEAELDRIFDLRWEVFRTLLDAPAA